MSEDKKGPASINPVVELEREARFELAEERGKIAKEKLKTALKKRESAALVLRNIDREIEDLKAEISNELRDISGS